MPFSIDNYMYHMGDIEIAGQLYSYYRNQLIVLHK